MTEYAELIAKLAEAAGPDRDLDADLWWMLSHADAMRCFNNGALGLPREIPAALPIPAGLGRAGVQAMAPRYTESVDAILAQIEKQLPGACYRLERGSPFTQAVHGAGCWATCGYPGEQEAGTGATAPLALCVAFLTALQAQEAKT